MPVHFSRAFNFRTYLTRIKWRRNTEQQSRRRHTRDGFSPVQNTRPAHGGYGYLEVQGRRCETRASIPLDAIPPTPQYSDMEVGPKCRSCPLPADRKKSTETSRPFWKVLSAGDAARPPTAFTPWLI